MLDLSRRRLRIGVFVDVQNIYLTVRAVHQDSKVNYKVMRDFFIGENRGEVTFTAFTCFDPRNKSQQGFINALALMGYRVVAKPFKQLPDGSIKANMDLEMAIEILNQAPVLDEVVLVTGDGDFAALLHQLSLHGTATRVLGPNRLTAPELIQACHNFMNLADIEGIFEVD